MICVGENEILCNNILKNYGNLNLLQYVFLEIICSFEELLCKILVCDYQSTIGNLQRITTLTSFSQGNCSVLFRSYYSLTLINCCCFFVFSFREIIQYIDEQFERFLRDESGLNRRNIVDNRIHCCFYFISPFGHGYVFTKQIYAEMGDCVQVVVGSGNLCSKRVRHVGPSV